jgi:4-amino-4-deoxy-L-arabinose transferase-like glycosyltransferase
VAAAALAAVYPPLVWIPSYVLSETIYSAFALLAAYMLQRSITESGDRANANRLGVCSGVLAGVAVLVRPAMLFFLPLAVLWLVKRRQIVIAAAFAIAAVVVVAPWTVRNIRTHGRFILVASEGGVTFWTGNHPLARGEGDLAANPELKLAELAFRRAHPGLTAEQLEPLYYRDALHSIAERPGRWLVLLLRKLFYTVVPIGPSYTLHSTRYWAASVTSYLLLLPLAIVGIGRLWRSNRRPTAVLVLGASSVLVGIVFFPQERFRIPVIDPVLIISAAALAGASAREHA